MIFNLNKASFKSVFELSNDFQIFNKKKEIRKISIEVTDFVLDDFI